MDSLMRGRQRRSSFCPQTLARVSSSFQTSNSHRPAHCTHPDLISTDPSVFPFYGLASMYWTILCLMTSYDHSLSAMQLVQFLQIPHILLQDWVLIKIIQHVTIQRLEGNVNFNFSHISSAHTPVSALFTEDYVSYLHEHFDVLVLPQEVFAESHPLWHQVQHFSFPLQSLLPVLLPSVSLGAIGGIRLRLQHRWRARSICWHQMQ